MSQTILPPFNRDDVDPQVLQSLSNLADELQSRAQKELLDEISELTLIALGIVLSLNKANTIIEEVKTPLNAVILDPVQDAMSTCKSVRNSRHRSTQLLQVLSNRIIPKLSKNPWMSLNMPRKRVLDLLNYTTLSFPKTRRP
jgi:hypothetical protein